MFSPPAVSTSPLAPISTSGVASAWKTSSTAITENAKPSSTARPSFRRTATTDMASAAAPASRPAAVTEIRCTIAGTWTIVSPQAR